MLNAILGGPKDKDMYNFDMDMAEYIHGKLKEYKAKKHGYPEQFHEEEWDDALDKMIEGFGALANGDHINCTDKAQFEKMGYALDKFSKYFMYFWV